MDLPPRIGPYPVERLLGAGAMGSVFLARHPETQAPLAIKVLHEHDPELIARFAREAEVMARIQDPRVVRALDAGLHEGKPYLVLEYCPGEDLAAVLKKRGSLEPREAAQLVAEIGRGLAAAHAVGVLHRDLKPANVLLDPEGKPKVGDFGLARVDKAPGAESLTQSGVILGTPAYMAPEQMHDARRVDARSDVYALGAILYECLGGKRPFGTGNALAIMQRAIEGELEPLPTGLPRELVEVVSCAMALDPADRYSEASLFVEALEDAFDPARQPGWSGRHLVGAVLALVTLGIGLGLGVRTILAKSSPAPLAPSPAAEETPTTTPLKVAPIRPKATESPGGSLSPEPSPVERQREYFESREYFAARSRFLTASIEELEEAAETGHEAAWTRLGERLQVGRGVKRDPKRGLTLVRRAAQAGDSEAMVLLGMYYAQSAKLKAESRRWQDRAMAHGHPRPMLARARRTHDKDEIRKAGALARQSLARGDPAVFATVALYAQYEGDHALAKEASEQGVKLGIPAAYAWRATLARGRGEGKSRAVFEDYRFAANQHLAVGLCGQARWLLEQPDPTPADRLVAERLLREAEETDPDRVSVERVLELWRSQKFKAWEVGIRRLAQLPTRALSNDSWGDIAWHLQQAVSDKRRLEFAPTVNKALRRAQAQISLDLRVSYVLGLSLYYKKSPKSHARAIQLFKRAAEAGHPESCHAWGVALSQGDTVERNPTRAIPFLKRAGEAGLFVSWRWLGDLYSDGKGVPRDFHKALEYYLDAAKDPERSASLCGRIAITLATLKRESESRTWGEEAAAGGDLTGSAALGRLLVLGKGGKRDLKRGMRLLKELVDQPSLSSNQILGAAVAAAFLQKCYERGLKGLDRDPEQAAHYKKRSETLRAQAIKPRAR